VTVYGRYLNSVAAPRIIVRVDVTRFVNNVSNVTDRLSQSEVLLVPHHVHLCSLSHTKLALVYCSRNFRLQSCVIRQTSDSVACVICTTRTALFRVV